MSYKCKKHGWEAQERKDCPYCQVEAKGSSLPNSTGSAFPRVLPDKVGYWWYRRTPRHKWYPVAVDNLLDTRRLMIRFPGGGDTLVEDDARHHPEAQWAPCIPPND